MIEMAKWAAAEPGAAVRRRNATWDLLPGITVPVNCNALSKMMQPSVMEFSAAVQIKFT